jgi:hypothetical protein
MHGLDGSTQIAPTRSSNLVYEGAYAIWVSREVCGVFYALAWCFGLSLLRPTARPRNLALVATALCFAIELSQLWHPYFLEVWRATLPGRLALGSGFSWLDLPYYAAGGLIGGIWLGILPFRKRRAFDHVRPMGLRP